MQLSQEDVRLFYKLHPHLLFYGNQQLKVIKDVPSVDAFMELPIEETVRARDALYERLDLIDAFVDSNPFRFSDEELEIVLSWKNMVRGRFQLFRYLKKYAVFLDDSSPMKAYGVVALIDSFEDILGSATHKDRRLLVLYHQEMGKMHARTYGKQLREMGLRGAWFAILEGLIVAGGKTREQVEQIVHEIVPDEKGSFVCFFHLKR